MACLFASLPDAAGQNALVVVLEGPDSAHAVAGYRPRGEQEWKNGGISDLRGAVARRDAVLFEATGVVEADNPIGAETMDERREKVLTFEDAITVATRMLNRGDIRLKHFVDIRALRESNLGNQQ